ncbi:MAG: hypothetical protein E4G93_03830, partial [Dehalococcoidia bacterium]
MTVSRHFLGWDEPVVTKVRRFLVGDDTPAPDALAGLLLLVPTQQSGRRLRQSLALHAAGHGVQLGHLRPRLPIDLVRPLASDVHVASPMECLALWTRVLLDVDYSQLLSLFPTGDGDRGFSWALATARLLQNLRNQLAAGGLTIRKVATDFSEVLEEPQRWGELAWLEESYLRRVEQAGRIDPGESRIRQAAAPHVPEGTTRIVLACTPDPDSIALAALARLSSDYEVQVLIHAPDEMSHRFDEWGRPTIAEWRDAIVEIPDTRRNLRLSGVPSEQSKLAMSILAEDMFGPLDIGIGMPDSEVVPFMAAEMARVGVEPFSPEGKPLSAHPLFVLLERYGSLVDNRSYASVAAFLRHPDVLHHLYHDLGLSSRRLLTELDEFQNMHLPADLQDILGRL